ncbi:MAG: DUF1559 domain-containing protein, partial [Planctomycetota bacterium]|nr:DUF1559 domain-containing protein [Planctomycetota bacterium]
VPVYRCPLDPGTGRWAKFTDPTSGTTYSGIAPNAGFASTNYMASIGNDTRDRTNAGTRGLFGTNSSVRFRDITDGTSNVLAVSEAIIGFPNRAVNATGPAATETCPSGGPTTDSQRARGYSWFYGERPVAYLFSARVPPNATTWDCGANTDRALFASRSAHVGSVHSLLADGAVRQISDNVDLTTWQNLGNKDDENQLGDF